MKYEHVGQNLLTTSMKMPYDMDVAPWCYNWVGRWDGSPGHVNGSIIWQILPVIQTAGLKIELHQYRFQH